MNNEKLKSILQDPFELAKMSDLSFLDKLEEESFEDYRRSNHNIIKRSIISTKQIVIIINNAVGLPVGSMTLRKYKKQLRIFSIAVKGDEQGKNFGKMLLHKAIECGYLLNIGRLTLEVDANNNQLISWYESFGFEQKKILEDYYSIQKHAIKMEMLIKDPNKYVVVTDYDTDFFKDIENVNHVKAIDYFDSDVFQNTKDLRVFNFCTNYKYQSIGYYVSLLALARNQVAYPSAGLIKDLDNQKVIKSIGEEINTLIQSSLSHLVEKEVVFNSYFGNAEDEKYQKLINGLNNLYHAPLMRYYFVRKEKWYLNKIKVLSLKNTLDIDHTILKCYGNRYFADQRFVRSSLKRYKYDMAILVDPSEELPPSDDKALKQFERAAEQIGFYVEYITKNDFARITEFDALFIRTTTNVNDYTYDFARFAYTEGLVVMDDPWSILRCANKIFLYEALRNAHVSMPNTWIINKKNNYESQVEQMVYPLVLKLPDSAFSVGVYKVKSKEECIEKLKVMFNQSELIIAQEYMPTEFDWRIGVLDGELLYACKYYMAKNHWQVVNWEGVSGKFNEGDYEALRLQDVPPKVLQTALKATAVIGDGLYGVDLKMNGENIYVIEVNDNPNIDHMVEDAIEGTSLYIKIMMSFYSRLENNMRIIRTIT
ncbi:MAG: GNAT family N-acetyltransferase [Clostridiales bacterium]|nr:GNAT family N-acetyltransferase [Clostridiales bacterium]